MSFQAAQPKLETEDSVGGRRSRKKVIVYEVPAMPKNYYTHVLESKDVSKVMSHMSNSFQSTRNVSFSLLS